MKTVELKLDVYRANASRDEVLELLDGGIQKELRIAFAMKRYKNKKAPTSS